jgi:hypothetical protein
LKGRCGFLLLCQSIKAAVKVADKGFQRDVNRCTVQLYLLNQSALQRVAWSTCSPVD